MSVSRSYRPASYDPLMPFSCAISTTAVRVFDNLRPQLTPGLSSGHRNLLPPTGELTMNQIVPLRQYFAAQSYVLQQQHSEHDLSGRRLAPQVCSSCNV